MEPPAFNSGTKVFDPSNPGVIGTISSRSPKQTPAGWKYRVDLPDGSHAQKLELTLTEFTDENSEDAAVLISKGLFGRTADLRRNLTYRILAGHLANIFYSLGVTNTDFYPHQFKPLLALLDSPVNGILIADEVGLGKTIEAGLIWTELRAREDLSKLLVVCPASLREKWRAELVLRFGIDAEIVNTEEILNAVKSPGFNAHTNFALIASYEAVSAPSASRPLKGQRHKIELSDALSQHEFERMFDCVIFDEAHVMRNRASARQKGGAALTRASEYQIMLSATPINLRNEDLFNLLHLLDPDNFAFKQDFDQVLRDNAQITRARDRVMDTRTSVSEVLALLREAVQSNRFQSYSRLKNIVGSLENLNGNLDKQKRVGIAHALEKINLLSHVVTRTKKRDVIERKVIRKVNKIPVTMSKHERKLYDLVTASIEEYGWRNDINHGFLLTQPQRMVTSCPSIFVPYLNNVINDDDSKPVKLHIAKRLQGAFDGALLQQEDSKYVQLKSIVSALDSDDKTDKLIIFSTFRDTVDYVSSRLNADGIPALAVKGGDPVSKSELIAKFRDTESYRVLVSTEVLAEGVDLQFCNKIVNYDLPWNPTRVEQRIGRIDRLGQEKSVIHIFNLFYEDTVDSRVIYRLYERIGIFEEALGESESILGEEIKKIEEYLYSDKRTLEEEQAQLESSELALEQIRHSREQLEQESQFLITHGQPLLDRIEASKHLSRAISEEDLVDYVRIYLTSQPGSHTFRKTPSQKHRYEIRLPAAMTVEFQDFCKTREIAGRTRVSTGHPVNCEFNKEITRQNSASVEYINQFHPLIKFINEKIKNRSDKVHPLVAIKLTITEELSIPSGKYLFCINSWYTPGLKKKEEFAYRAFRIDPITRLEPNSEELLVQLCRLHGEDWIDASVALKREPIHDVLELAEEGLNEDFLKRKLYQQQENSDRLKDMRNAYDKDFNRRNSQLHSMILDQTGKNEQAAKMNQGKVKKLDEEHELRMAKIDSLEKEEMKTTAVCVGIVDVYQSGDSNAVT